MPAPAAPCFTFDAVDFKATFYPAALSFRAATVVNRTWLPPDDANAFVSLESFANDGVLGSLPSLVCAARGCL